MQTVITIEFDGQLRRIQAATPEDAIAELRAELEEADPDSDVDLKALSTQCVTAIDRYPTWEEFEAQFKPVTNHLDTNASCDGHMFQTYCEERCFVHAQPLEHVWTIAEDCTEDLRWIHPGFYWINSIGHIVTECPWKKGQSKFLG